MHGVYIRFPNVTALKVSTARMNELSRAMTSSKLLNAPYNFSNNDLTQIAKAGGSAGQFSQNFDKTVFTNLVNFANITATYQNIDKLKAKLSQQNSGPTLEGTNFIIKYMGEHPAEFNGGAFTFESYQDAWARYIDVEDQRSGAPGSYIYYEFKSVQEIDPAAFVTQFVKDLQTANNLNQIRWIFDHSKMSEAMVREKVLAALNTNKEQLREVVILDKFNAYAGKINYTKSIDNIDNLMDFINENNDWFNLIFK